MKISDERSECIEKSNLPAVIEITGVAGSLTTEELRPMTAEEFLELDRIEIDIEECFETMGELCHEIKSKKLYRQDKNGNFRTWGAYCTGRWEKTKQWIDTVIRAWQVSKTLVESNVSILPVNVSQANQLAGLPKDKMVMVAEQVASIFQNEGRKPTTMDYKMAAKPYKEKVIKKTAPKKPTAASPTPKQEMGHKADSEKKQPVTATVPDYLVAQMKEFFQESKIEPKSERKDGLTVFQFQGSTKDQTDLLTAIGGVLRTTKAPVVLEVTVRPPTNA